MTRTLVLILVSLLGSGAVLALPGDADPRARRGAHERPDPHRDAGAAAERHRSDAELRSRRELRALDRDARRQADRALGGPPTSPAEVRAARDRARAEEQQDALRARVESEERIGDLRALERRAGHPLGPVTRQVLERSRIEVRLVDRLGDLDREAREEELRLRGEETRQPPF